MSTYNEMFKLGLKDVDLIERAVRQQIRHLSLLEASAQHKEPEAADNQKKIIDLIGVLGNPHIQKNRVRTETSYGCPVRLTN